MILRSFASSGLRASSFASLMSGAKKLMSSGLIIGSSLAEEYWQETDTETEQEPQSRLRTAPATSRIGRQAAPPTAAARASAEAVTRGREGTEV